MRTRPLLLAVALVAAGCEAAKPNDRTAVAIEHAQAVAADMGPNVDKVLDDNRAMQSDLRTLRSQVEGRK